MKRQKNRSRRVGKPSAQAVPDDPPAEPSAWPLRLRWILGLTLFGFAARGLYLLDGQRQGLFGSLFLDSAAYAKLAQLIRSGAGPGDHPYLLSPLYPYLLAPFTNAQGQLNIVAVQWIQALFGSLTVGLCALIAARIAGRGAGILAGLTAAVFGPLIYYDGAILVASLQGFFLTLALALLVYSQGAVQSDGPFWRSRDIRLWTGVGLALGCSAVLRPTGLALGAVIVGALWIGELDWKKRSFRRPRLTILRSVGLVFGMLLIVAPFGVRNLRHGGEAVLLSANGGFNFWVGNHGKAIGLFKEPAGYDFDNDPVGLEIAGKALGKSVSYVEASGWWRERALRDMRDDPGHWIKLLGHKLIWFGNPTEIVQMVQDFAWYVDLLWTLRFPLDARVLLILALLCPLALWFEGGREALARARWPVVVLAGYAAVIILFFVTSRFRAPVMPTAIVLAAIAVMSSWTLLRRFFASQSNKIFVVAGSFLALSVTSYLLYDAGSALYRYELPSAGKLYQRAILHLEQGENEQAIELLGQSLELRDDSEARSRLVTTLMEAGRSAEAAEQLSLYVLSEPNNAVAWNNLGFLRETVLRDMNGAHEAFENAARLDPTAPQFQFSLGRLAATLGRRDQALTHLRRFLELAPPEVPVRKAAEEMIEQLSREGDPP